MYTNAKIFASWLCGPNIYWEYIRFLGFKVKGIGGGGGGVEGPGVKNIFLLFSYML